MVRQQSQRRLRQSQSGPEKTNLADHRKHAHFFWREVAQHQQCQSDLQRKRFGFEGDLFKKRQEIVKPVQDKVYNAIQKLAVEKQYDIIFDKSEGITVIFVDPKLDKSEDILRMIGGDKK